MIAHKISFSFITQIFIEILGFASLILVSRKLGPGVIGTLSFATAYIALFQSFSDLGFGTAHIKRVSEGKDLGRCNGIFFTVYSILNLLMMVIVIASIFIPKYFFHKRVVSPNQEIIIYIILLGIFFANIYQMVMFTYSGRREIAKGSIFSSIGQLVNVSGKIFVVLLGFGVIALAGVGVLTSFVLMVLYLLSFKGYPIKKPTKKYFKLYASYALPVILIGFVTKYAYNLDRILINYFCGVKDLGLYAVAKSFIVILTTITASSGALLFPTISNFYTKGDIKSIINMTKNAERYISMVTVPMVVLFIVLSKLICEIFLGKNFIHITPTIIAISALLVLIQAITQPYTSQIGATGHMKLALVLTIIIMLSNIIFGIILIPSKIFGIKLFGMGAIGAGLASLLSAVISSILYRVFAFKITKSKLNSTIFSHLFAGGMMGAIMVLLRGFLPKSNLITVALLAIPGLVTYLAILLLLKEFKISDLKYIFNLINPKNLKNYAVSEFKAGYQPDNAN